MSGLLLKDFLGLKRYMKQLSVSLVVFFIISVSLKRTDYLMGMVILMSSMTVFTAMNYDEAAKWDKYALSMPISKSALVSTKYILLITVTLGGGFLSALVSFVMSFYFKLDKPLEVFIVAGAISGVALIMHSIILPLAFKLGVEKSRILVAVIFAIPSFLIIAYSNMGFDFNIPIPTEQQIKQLLYIFPFITAIILYLSYRVSVYLLQKKEF